MVITSEDEYFVGIKINIAEDLKLVVQFLKTFWSYMYVHRKTENKPCRPKEMNY